MDILKPIKNVKMTVDCCVSSLGEIAATLGMTYSVEKKHDKEVHFMPSYEEDRGLIRIYDTKSGLTIDPTLGENKKINATIMKELNTRLLNGGFMSI
ncbi:hypothetical protein FDN13_01280 [Caloramator sp. E03]|uniref:hypothetical protein n=1 Tax=Caloramator sp. E03 TaxID=2576307 RepID=UPI0011104A8D|nr:hypothetical protein [Caloramator sp. E03]QCX32437.1 hypothetical protein FDN13_01280 [Caloramator sp. E03]